MWNLKIKVKQKMYSVGCIHLETILLTNTILNKYLRWNRSEWMLKAQWWLKVIWKSRYGKWKVLGKRFHRFRRKHSENYLVLQRKSQWSRGRVKPLHKHFILVTKRRLMMWSRFGRRNFGLRELLMRGIWFRRQMLNRLHF